MELQIIDEGSVREYYPAVRDREDLKVNICDTSKVIFLESSHHIKEYYADKWDLSYYWHDTREEGLVEFVVDDTRRFHQFKDLVIGKNYLDIGTGLGGILDFMKPLAKNVYGLEVQKGVREDLKNRGYNMFGSVSEIDPNLKMDVVSLFHVFEHLTDPLSELKSYNEILRDGGKIIIEVPHAKDPLIQLYDSNTFKKTTFWSEHIILHTRDSLTKMLKATGFKNIQIQGFQRYPLSNHLYWLSKNKPNGHVEWSFLSSPELESAYSSILFKNDITDTLIAIAEK